MPIYDYTCSSCGRVTEVIHGINDAGPAFCPSCGAEGTMRKALSAPAVVFKGSGWAKVDRRSSSSGSRSSGSSAKPASATKADGSSSTGASASGATGSADPGSGASGSGGGGTASSSDGGGD